MSRSTIAQDYIKDAIDFSESQALAAPPALLLKQMLSTRSTISESPGEGQDRPAPTHSPASLVQIGQGQCGTVWHLPGSSPARVYKLPLDRQRVGVLRNDRVCHLLVLMAFAMAPSLLRYEISVPKCFGWLTPKCAAWKRMRFPPSGEHGHPEYALISELIEPIPMRGAFLDSVLPAHLKSQRSAIFCERTSQQFLVRVYLGRRDPEACKAYSPTRFLYNFPLLVNEVERLGADAARLAGIMADALAILHWGAHIDANDVEFVLGSSPTRIGDLPTPAEVKVGGVNYVGPVEEPEEFSKRHVRLWLLDFNMCKQFKEDEGGLKQICDGFWFNDPYYPRPGSKNAADVALWAVFKTRYLGASAQLTGSGMPLEFIGMVEAEGEKRRVKVERAGAGSLFGAMMG